MPIEIYPDPLTRKIYDLSFSKACMLIYVYLGPKLSSSKVDGLFMFVKYFFCDMFWAESNSILHRILLWLLFVTSNLEVELSK